MNEKSRRRTRLTGTQLLLMLVAIIVTVIYFFPIIWMFSTSIKPPEQVLKIPPILIPSDPQLDSYLVIFGLPSKISMSTKIPGAQYFVNSFIIALSTTFLTLLMAVPAAYGLARTRIRGKMVYLLFLLTAQMLPSVLIVVPLFVLFRPLGLVNSYQGVILADTGLALPFAIIILRTSFLQIPLDLEEAALIDGCSRPQALGRIIVPLVRSGVVAVAMFSFLTAWGEFVFAVSFLSSEELHPVSVGIFKFIGMYKTQWGSLMAFSVLIALPALIAFLLLQKQFIGGLTTGAVK